MTRLSEDSLVYSSLPITTAPGDIGYSPITPIESSCPRPSSFEALARPGCCKTFGRDLRTCPSLIGRSESEAWNLSLYKVFHPSAVARVFPPSFNTPNTVKFQRPHDPTKLSPPWIPNHCSRLPITAAGSQPLQQAPNHCSKLYIWETCRASRNS